MLQKLTPVPHLTYRFVRRWSAPLWIRQRTENHLHL